MKVWIALRDDHEDREVLGVFTAKSDADNRCERGRAEFRGYGYSVEEHDGLASIHATSEEEARDVAYGLAAELEKRNIPL